MVSRAKKQPKVVLERGAPDRILPKHFLRVLLRRYFPVLSLTYISSIIGIAFKRGDFEKYLLGDQFAYAMALLPALWVSVPAILWIILRGSHLFNHVANLWYIITAVLMSFTLLLSFVLLPEVDFMGAKLYLLSSIPMMVVMYFFFVKALLPAGAAHTLNVLGLTALLFGAMMRFWI